MRTGRPDPVAHRGDRADAALPRLLIVGATGRLGTVVHREAMAQGFPITGAVGRVASADRPDVLPATPENLARMMEESDVCLSATTPRAERQSLPIAARLGVASVVATTGFDPPIPDWIRRCARRIPIALDANFSLGVNLLRRSLRSLGPLPDGFDVSIVETHRRAKPDHPSATARSISAELRGAGVRRWHAATGVRPAGAVEIASLRGGETPGLHVVQIAGPSEMLRFEHLAYGREAFAGGMLLAARWLFRNRASLRPDLYTLDDVLSGPMA
ncbi:MAG TPA: dihydrodipicolinate reductase C-terminal domain-containing protein [Thermoplasmata archaeon]|nr:dihydrodipicolinate reductase C-terminal domain-containing protein [Thermoplasmata archaeon]